MQRKVAAGVWVGIPLAVMLAGAVYLYATRGPALLLDLSSGMAGLFCL